MPEVVALTRLALAVVLIVSAIAKLRDREGTREAVRAFGVPPALVGSVATGLPFVEIALAALLVAPDPAATVGAVGSLALLAAFTVAIIVNLARGRRPECGCFGSISRGHPIGWRSVVRNVGLMALAGVSLIGAGSLGFAPTVIAGLGLVPAVLLVSAALVVGALVAMALIVRRLREELGSVSRRLSSLEQGAPARGRPAASELHVRDLAGALIRLDALLSAQRPTLLVYIRPGCGACTSLLPDLSAWQSDPADPLAVVVVSDGSADATRARVESAGPLRVLLDEDRAVAATFGINGSPAAVLLGPDGRVMEGPRSGPAAVRALHGTPSEDVISAPTGQGEPAHDGASEGSTPDGHDTLGRFPTIPAGVESVDVDGKVLVFKGERLHLLPGSGAEIWGSLDGQTTLADLMDRLSDRYPDAPDVARDVEQFVVGLAGRGLIELRTEAESPSPAGT